MEKKQATVAEMATAWGIFALLTWGIWYFLFSGVTPEGMAKYEQDTAVVACNEVMHELWTMKNSGTVITWADLRPQMELWEYHRCARFGKKP